MAANLSSSLRLLLLVCVAMAVPQIGERGRCPDTCPESSQPVCGTNKVIYRNDCYLQRAACTAFPGLTKLNNGPCGQVSNNPPSRCREECTKIYLPLCGTDDKTYNNMCLLEVANCHNVRNNSPRINVKYENACVSPDLGVEVVKDLCQRTCSDAYEPSCGTDRLTYYNKCELSIAVCHDDQVGLHHAGTCAGFSGRGARRPSTSQPRGDAASSSVVSQHCPDICTGGFRPVCGSDGLTYGSDCYLQLAQCRNPGLAKKDDGVCTKDCSLQCDPTRNLVCGSDGITYNNECFLVLAKCRDSSVRRIHDGPCVFVEKSECRSRRCGSRGLSLCGSDGITYLNKCHFDAATCYNQGLLKIYDGPCKPDPRVCGRCEDNARRLVCGSDRVTYLNHCHLILQACRSGVDIAKVSNGPCLRRREAQRE